MGTLELILTVALGVAFAPVALLGICVAVGLTLAVLGTAFELILSLGGKV